VTLRLFNGRGNRPRTWLFVAARSKADAARLLDAQFGGRGWLRELNVYWNKDVWGNSMDGIKPARGIWEKDETNFNSKPVRLK
jgi:hypothetical protein